MSWSRRLGAVALAALIVLSAAAGGVSAAPAAQDDGETADDGELPPAEEAYVTDDGDVVLAYRNDSEGSQVEFGLDVSESVFHALVVTNGTDGDVTGQATAVLDPDRVQANGSLAAPSPDALSSLTIDATGERTDENAAMQASLEATVDDENASATALVSGASASGQLRVGPDAFAANGEFDADLRVPMGEPQHQAFTLRETADGYTLEGAQNYTLDRRAAEEWRSRERAERLLSARYAQVAQSLGGTGEVTLESYEWTNTSSGARVDLEFTVEYTGVDEGLSRLVAASLADSEEYDLTREEARRVGERIANVTVDEVSVRFDQTPESVSGSFSAELSDYEGAVRAAIDVARSVQTDDVEVGSQVDRIEKTFDARQEAGLVETVSVDVSVDSPRGSPTTVAASLDYATENWAAYRAALSERGIDPAAAEFEFHARTEGGEILAEGSATVEQDGLLRTASDALLNASAESEDAEAERVLRAFRDADLRRAKADVSVTQGEVRVEAAAAFENLAALRDAWRASTGSDLRPASAVGRTEDGQLHTYVRLESAVGTNATESDVRALGPVNEDTAVHLAGEYNRTFPETDVAGAYDYLGLSYDPPADGETATPTDGGGAGFGVGAAAVALLGAALLARHRKE